MGLLGGLEFLWDVGWVRVLVLVSGLGCRVEWFGGLEMETERLGLLMR